MGDKWGVAFSLKELGLVACEQCDYIAARTLYKESLSIRRGIGDKQGIAATLHELGTLAYRQGDYAAAQALHEEGLNLRREMGDKTGIAWSLANLGDVASSQGDYAAAEALHEESLSLCRDMGNKRGIAIALLNLGFEAYLQEKYVTARVLCEESLVLSKETDEKQVMAYALLGLGLLDLVENKPEARGHILHSLRLRVETNERLFQTSSLIGTAGLVLQEGNQQFAVELLGAVESALKKFNAPMEPEMKLFHEQTLTKVKMFLGDRAFQSAWEEGSQWSLEEAVKRALGE